MVQRKYIPDYIFESSWEVCNKVGGIYTVLSTRAKTLQEMLPDHIVFIGPDCWKQQTNPYFKEDKALLAEWKAQASDEGLNVKVGRWSVPGNPIAILVDFEPFYSRKDQIYTRLWEDFQVDSLHAYGDYDEASMFSYAAAKVVESFYRHNVKPGQKVIYHGNEWMTCLGLLYIRKVLPQIGTVFTTHATSIGRSIAGNNKPLYQYLPNYNGDQMAAELNMQSKHSVEKQAAWNVDCFTTVSDITAVECKELLDKSVDVVLPNGFEDDFVPKGVAFTAKRRAARQRLLKVANALLGERLDDDTLILSTSGRYEFRNKGIDVYIEAVNMLRQEPSLDRPVLAFIEVPAWVKGPREDLKRRLAEQGDTIYDTSLPDPFITHELYNMDSDRALGMMRHLGITNRKEDKVKVIFLPSYLTGDDGIVNLSYYDVVLGHDLCVYPSYYEPWGYTPLEAIAFHVPCVTTDLSGFGLWVNSVKGDYGKLEDGVEVIHRTDYNYFQVAQDIKNTVSRYLRFTPAETSAARKSASALSKKALWKSFIKPYLEAYAIALKKAGDRTMNKTINQ